jgi:hypothetical protein
MSTINMSTCRPIHPENLTLIGTGMSGWFIVTPMCRTFITATTTDKSTFSSSRFIAGFRQIGTLADTYPISMRFSVGRKFFQPVELNRDKTHRVSKYLTNI